ncbi:methyl-accepting chemotaxis protein [Alteromonas aestuariivivens]|nr:methyl-accepting chemotaxis protein [Alteromonas aestuariivivens]
MYPWIFDGHRIFRILLLVQWLLSLVIGAMTGEWLVSFVVGIPILALPLFLSFSQPETTLSRICIGIAVQLMTALHIHQTYGLIEIHFQIFVVLAFLAYFRDWRVIAASTLTVAVHHIGFFLLQSQGAEIYVFEASHLSFRILLLHAAFALAEGIVLIFMARRSLSEGLGAAEMQNAISTILARPDAIDLSVSLPVQTAQGRALSALIAQIRQLVNEAVQLTQDVLDNSQMMRQVSKDINDASQRSNQEITSISSSTEEIALSMQMAAERCQSANQTVSTATETTHNSNQAILATSQAIGSLKQVLNTAAKTNAELSERCSGIADAMRSITSVAEQTNLLALNAAIESARAGEHGRGFAVVADEVRALAIRSRDSAREISAITEQLVTSTSESVGQMQNCISLVDDAVASSTNASQAMEQIQHQISQAMSNIQQVASASVEQQDASASIARSTAKMRAVSEQESSAAQSMSVEVDNLTRQCASMQAVIQRFVV